MQAPFVTASPEARLASLTMLSPSSSPSCSSVEASGQLRREFLGDDYCYVCCLFRWQLRILEFGTYVGYTCLSDTCLWLLKVKGGYKRLHWHMLRDRCRGRHRDIQHDACMFVILVCMYINIYLDISRKKHLFFLSQFASYDFKSSPEEPSEVYTHGTTSRCLGRKSGHYGNGSCECDIVAFGEESCPVSIFEVR